MVKFNIGETGTPNGTSVNELGSAKNNNKGISKRRVGKMGLRYRIDRDHLIVWVAGNWDAFAIDNEAPELAGGMVIGRRLWEFITDPSTREIYRQLVERAFAGRSTKFNIRCDAPEMRRCAQVSITPSDDGNVEFEILTTKVEPRPSQDLLRRADSTAKGLITSCSWCNKIKTSRDEWHEIEDAIDKLHFFDLECTPTLSHGICPDCALRMTELYD